MFKYKVYGGNKLYGKLEVDTAKNALLPILAGSIMCDQKVIIKKITYYEDVNKMIDILNHLGVTVKKTEYGIEIDSSSICKNEIPSMLSSTLRASIFFLGPLISKFKKATIYYPGGCNIGCRPINIHLDSLKTLGATIYDKHGYVCVDGTKMKSGFVHLPFPSVGATENVIMASLFLKGKTTISGAAKEPEIIDLCNFLNAMGAKIVGAGTDMIEIDGITNLKSVTFTPINDRIIAGTYALIPLITGGEIEIDGVNPNHILPLINIIKNSSCKIHILNDKIVVQSDKRVNGFGMVETLPYPHFPTDLQQPLCSAATTANGTTVIVENLFENRFKHVPNLVKMGANIRIKDRVCVVEGVKKLLGADLQAEDLRGGASLLLASLGAEGYSIISNADIICRGYFDLDKKLKSIGANVEIIE
ncbi:MAG: UDP-N-acetylglucosamine 1-carboxyvinyltransferase [Clostridia bacterium]|nr:UDP-N-acetylglucosamine 1-carboxyvinyltransferase [Clostridia bacterium]